MCVVTTNQSSELTEKSRGSIIFFLIFK